VHVDYAEGTCHCAFLAANALVGIDFGNARCCVHVACAGWAYCCTGSIGAHVASDDKRFTESLISHNSNTGNHFPALAIMIERTPDDAASASSAFFLIVNQDFSVVHNRSPLSKKV
jgi:hypothetical protein